MRKIIYTRPDGGLSIVHPAFNTIGEVEGFTTADAELRAWNNLITKGITPRWLDASEIPTDRTFRDAWVDTGIITVDMTKAKEIHKNKLRSLRKPLLEALDAKYLRADEIGDVVEKSRIATLKQTLRDITAITAVTGAVTPEQLKVAGISILSNFNTQ